MPFQTICDTEEPERLECIGIGDVLIPVHLFPERTGRQAHGMLHLRNVLHSPASICNLIGGLGTDDYDKLNLGGLGRKRHDAEITKENGRWFGYFVRGRFWTLKLSEPPIGPELGPSDLRAKTSWDSHIKAFWTEEGRREWANHPTGH